MGLDKRPGVKDSWTTEVLPQHIAWYYNIMSRDRFEAIYQTVLHASIVGAESKEKSEPFLKRLVDNFKQCFTPMRILPLIRWQLDIKADGNANNSMHRNQRNIFLKKPYALCDSLGRYEYNLLVYFGKETPYNPNLEPDIGQSEIVFEYLNQTSW